MQHRRTRLVPILFAWTALTANSAFASTEQAQPAEQSQQQERPVAAVWQMREAAFQYRSNLAIFSCGALQARVAEMLAFLGAHGETQVIVEDCSSSLSAPNTSDDMVKWARTDVPWRPRNGNEPVPQIQYAGVRIRAWMPSAASEQLLEKLERDQPRRDLIVRMTRKPPQSVDTSAVFVAQRRTVTMSRRTANLGPLDCELVEDLEGVLDQLGVSVVGKGVSCDRDKASRIPPTLVVSVLTPVGSIERVVSGSGK